MGGKKTDGLTMRLRIFLIAWVSLILFWSLAFMKVEGLAFIDAVYFSVVTVTTVGYGDIHAQTSLGKIMAVLLILTGVGTFGGLVASLTEVALNRRERRARHEKLNMVIGAFFSEVGTTLLTYFSDFDTRVEEIKQDLQLSGDWTAEQFDRVTDRIRRYEYSVDARQIDFEHLRGFLVGKREFLLRLLENPSIMEHEEFTDLLLAVFHLTEELGHRKKVKELPATDQAHLAGDVKRIYRHLVHQWLDYMRYLKTSYPYLFSLAIRTNPFDEKATPEVTS
jgi:hypothetical protein